MYMTAKMLGKGDVAVAISNTGHTQEIIRSIAVASASGARTIGVSGTRNSPLIESCDVGLVVETLENTNIYTPTVSRLSHLVVVDILSTAVSVRREAAHHEKLADMKEQLAKIRPKA
jgi:RpiR family carbohydrate utilization transcriptional regulator